jgi:hypothetical protein
MDWLRNLEPTLDDALSGPIILAALASSGITVDAMRVMLQEAAKAGGFRDDLPALGST